MCYHPWTGLHIDPQQGIMPCCKYSHIVSHDIKEYFSSDEVRELRESFTRGEQPAGCKNCWDDEAAGNASKRELDWEYVYEHRVPELDSLKVLVTSFGNTCNLACRTCFSSDSSRWQPEAVKLQRHFPEFPVYKHNTFYRNAEYQAELRELITDLEYLDLNGGEPFLADADIHLALLDHLIEHNAKNIRLRYITNTTVFPSEEFWSRWDKFKSVDISMSIDGVGKHFEYIRWPANWDTCYTNIKRYQENMAQLPNGQLSISHTVSLYNVFYLPEFVIWCIKERLPKPHLNTVYFPPEYRLNNLPKTVKQAVTDKLSRFKNSDINSAVATMSSPAEQPFDLTVNMIQALDQDRKQNFSTTFPEFYNIIKSQFA